MPRLAGNTTLRHPESSEVLSLIKGDQVPDWAADMVGAHLLAPEPPTDDPGDTVFDLGSPSADWTVAQLRDYAKAHEVTLGADVTTKAAILEALNAAE